LAFRIEGAQGESDLSILSCGNGLVGGGRRLVSVVDGDGNITSARGSASGILNVEAEAVTGERVGVGSVGDRVGRVRILTKGDTQLTSSSDSNAVVQQSSVLRQRSQEELQVGSVGSIVVLTSKRNVDDVSIHVSVLTSRGGGVRSLVDRRRSSSDSNSDSNVVRVGSERVGTAQDKLASEGSGGSDGSDGDSEGLGTTVGCQVGGNHSRERTRGANNDGVKVATRDGVANERDVNIVGNVRVSCIDSDDCSARLAQSDRGSIGAEDGGSVGVYDGDSDDRRVRFQVGSVNSSIGESEVGRADEVGSGAEDNRLTGDLSVGASDSVTANHQSTLRKSRQGKDDDFQGSSSSVGIGDARVEVDGHISVLVSGD
jgi:hypothetical protein